eukprot:365693-Chlamydomonas_euryale.AAC.4
MPQSPGFDLASAGRSGPDFSWPAAIRPATRQVSDVGNPRHQAPVTENTCVCGWAARIVGVKLTDRHTLDTLRQECGTPSPSLMVCRQTFSLWGTRCDGRMRIACRGVWLLVSKVSCGRWSRKTTEVDTGSQEH